MIHVTDVMPEESALWSQEFIFTAPRPVMSLNEIYDLLPKIATVSNVSNIVAVRMESGGFIEITSPFYTRSQGVMVMRSGLYTGDEYSDDAKLWSLVCCGPDLCNLVLTDFLSKQASIRSHALAKLRASSNDPQSFCPEVKDNIDDWASNAMIRRFVCASQGSASAPPLTAKAEALKHLLISELRSQSSLDGAQERAISLAKTVNAAFDTLTD